MREQGVDQPGLRGEVASQGLRPAVLTRDLIQQSLELGDVAVDRLLEGAVSAILAADLVEGLLAGRRVEPLGEGLALAALIAVPHFGGEIAVHQAADVERQRLQRIASDAWLRRRAAARNLTACTARIGAVQQIGEPAVTPG